MCREQKRKGSIVVRGYHWEKNEKTKENGYRVEKNVGIQGSGKNYTV